MFPLFETLRIQAGVPQNLEWHQKRMNISSMAVFGKTMAFQLPDEIVVPPMYSMGYVRCRVDYNLTQFKLSFHPYKPIEIESLRLIDADNLYYPHKFTDRRALEAGYALRDGCDEVLFVKNGLITDTSIANVILWNGIQWLTPASPLLPGTCRARLLAGKKIQEANIRVEDLGNFTKLRLINALRNFEDANDISINSIEMDQRLFDQRLTD
jgi:4-amino-4-deoxychorismate lyase